MAAGVHPGSDGFFDFCKARVKKPVLVYTTSPKLESITGELQDAYPDGIVVKEGQNTLFINRDGIVALYEMQSRTSVYGGQP